MQASYSKTTILILADQLIPGISSLARTDKSECVVLKVDAANQQFVVELAGEVIKTIPIKGLQNQLMPFAQYLEFICQQAVSNWRLYLRKRLQYLPLAA